MKSAVRIAVASMALAAALLIVTAIMMDRSSSGQGGLPTPSPAQERVWFANNSVKYLEEVYIEFDGREVELLNVPPGTKADGMLVGVPSEGRFAILVVTRDGVQHFDSHLWTRPPGSPELQISFDGETFAYR